MEEFLKTYGILFGAIAAVGIAVCGYFRSSFKELREKIHELDKKIEKLETKDKVLESANAQIAKLLPDIHSGIQQLGKDKK